MHTYRNTGHLGITPKIGDITDKGCVVLITEDGRIITDWRGAQEVISAEFVNLVSRRTAKQ